MAKLAQNRRLRTKVEAKLKAKWSPEEISGWLAWTYPEDPEMQVSHETIYQSIFLQGRGALRHELPTRSDLSIYNQRQLDAIAKSLNTRPRKSLGL